MTTDRNRRGGRLRHPASGNDHCQSGIISATVHGEHVLAPASGASLRGGCYRLPASHTTNASRRGGCYRLPASRTTGASLRGGCYRLPASRTTGASLRGGFTLIELLTALLILSLLALMSYRSLGAVLDAREQVTGEADKWRHVSSFFARFERDVQLVAPRPVRSAAGNAAPWLGQAGAAPGPRLEISRFASAEGVDSPRRVAYALNDQQEIELWLWPGLDLRPDVRPARYPVLAGVTTFEVQYLDDDRSWLAAWPASPDDAAIPRAVRLRIVLVSGEAIVRVFALNS